MSSEQQMAEIRRLMQQVQKAVSRGQMTFTPEMDRRIRAQYEGKSMEEVRGFER